MLARSPIVSSLETNTWFVQKIGPLFGFQSIYPQFKENNGNDQRLNLVIRSKKQQDLKSGAERFCSLLTPHFV
jgi:hypothetical protein